MYAHYHVEVLQESFCVHAWSLFQPGFTCRRSCSLSEAVEQKREIPFFFLLQWHEYYPQCWRESVSRGKRKRREIAAAVTDKSVAELVFPDCTVGQWEERTSGAVCTLKTRSHTEGQAHRSRRSSERGLTSGRYSMIISPAAMPPFYFILYILSTNSHVTLHLVFQVGWQKFCLWLFLI